MEEGPIYHDLILVDSSDDDTPFIIPGSAASRARPARRVVLVPGSVDATPQSVQDRELDTRLDTESVDSGHSLNSAEGWSEVSGQDDDIELPVVAGIPLVRPSIRSQRVGFEQTDDWNLQEVFRTRASVMRTVSRFLWASFRAALKVALEEILAGQQNRQIHRQERGWKLFLALPRMLLHRPPRGGLISKEKLTQRFDKFVSGQWTELLRASCECAEEASSNGIQTSTKERHQPGFGIASIQGVEIRATGRTLFGSASIGGSGVGTWQWSHVGSTPSSPCSSSEPYP